MRAQHREDYRTCTLCEQTTRRSYVVTGSEGVLTLCETCAGEIVRTLGKAIKKQLNEHARWATDLT